MHIEISPYLISYQVSSDVSCCSIGVFVQNICPTIPWSITAIGASVNGHSIKASTTNKKHNTSLWRVEGQLRELYTYTHLILVANEINSTTPFNFPLIPSIKLEWI